jgi:hypothetical protein
MGKRRRAFTPEFRAEAVEKYRASGRPLHEVARELGIASSVLRNWHERPDIYLTNERDSKLSDKQELILYGIVLIIGVLLIFIFERAKFASSIWTLAFELCGIMQTYVLMQLTCTFADSRRPGRVVLATAAILVAINAIALALGQAALVRSTALLSIGLYGAAWLIYGLAVLELKLKLRGLR